MLRVEDIGDGIRCIGLDRAAKRNAIGVEMTLALQAALVQAQHEAQLHTLVFHGIGGHFCAGMDIKEFFAGAGRAPAELQRARAATEHWRTRLLRTLPQTLITAVQGSCFGAALPILAASAAVFASRDSRFGLPEINFGLVPGAQIVKAAGDALTPRGLAYSALTGRPFDVERAHAWGLVSAITDDDPLASALALAHALAERRRAAGTSPAQSG